MRVFVYEYLTALGIGRDPADPMHAMYREGRAMRDAVAEDFRALPGVEVVTLDGANAKREKDRFREHITGCDRCLVIAPELGHELGRKLEWARKAGVPALNCTEAAVRITSCKVGLGQLWEEAGVPTPHAESFLDWLREPLDPDGPDHRRFPVICKPDFGAGSTATFRVDRMDDLLPTLRAAEAEGQVETSLLLQDFVPGRPASVAFLCGPAGNVPLVPAFQHLTDDGRFHYLGGALPIPADLADRAVKLGARALGCVSGLCGYVGVDLVLGAAADGSDDYAIEINPRLTTSYVGLRALTEFNLAGAMLAAAEGEPPPELRWKPGAVRFTPDGVVGVSGAASHAG